MKTKHYDGELIKDIKRKVDEEFLKTGRLIGCYVENSNVNEYTGLEHCRWFVRNNFNWYMHRHHWLHLEGNEIKTLVSRLYKYKGVIVVSD